MGGFLNNILAQFQNLLNQWQPDILVYGTRLMVGIAALGGMMVVGRSAISGMKGGWLGLFQEMMFGFVKIACVYIIMGHIGDWGAGLASMGQAIGMAISGQSPYTLSPSGVFGWGLQLAHNLAVSRAASLWLTSPIGSVIDEITIHLILPVIWFCAAAMYLFVLLEMGFVIVFGPLLVAFATMDVAFPMLVNWAWWLLSLILKTVMIILILAFGAMMARQWSSAKPDGLMMIVEALLIFGLVWKFPDHVARLVSLRHGSALAFGEQMMGALWGAGAGAVSGAAGAGVEMAGQAARWVKGPESIQTFDSMAKL